ncbi:MAG: DUF202 domain-containing protein [Acidimicrobiia bacterium]|nr:DUF202 domain-containing protein [Acidimicrobiia bacterium]
MSTSRNPIRPNRGSRARDHLANERTYLAWVRTALGIIGLGVLVGKLVEAQGVEAEIAGLTMVGVGAASLIYATIRYERVRVQLEEGMFQTASTGPIVITALALLMTAAAVVFVLV